MPNVSLGGGKLYVIRRPDSSESHPHGPPPPRPPPLSLNSPSVSREKKNNLIFHLCNANRLGFDYSRLIDCQTRLLSSGSVCKFAYQMRQREEKGRREERREGSSLLKVREKGRMKEPGHVMTEGEYAYPGVLDCFI